MKALSKVVLASLVIACGSPQKAPRSRKTPKEIVNLSKPAIVRIEVGADRVGTGFLIDASGLVATNLHVVVAADDIQVKLLDGTKYKVKRMIGWDATHDLALLDIDPSDALPTLTLGDSDTAEPGDPVLAIGNPLGLLDYTVSDGLLSAVRVMSPEFTLLQITAPISQGSSGGPLFNGYGEVIGIVNAFLAGGQSLNFAIPAKYLVTLAATTEPAQTMAEFKSATEKLLTAARGELDSGADIPESRIARKVPVHDLAIFDGCKKEDLADTANAIGKAIEIGAPLYNEGLAARDESKFEACFRIYEMVVATYEKASPCAGIRTAFGDGLQRAETVKTAKEKAWALRDTFDGMLNAIMRKAQASP